MQNTGLSEDVHTEAWFLAEVEKPNTNLSRLIQSLEQLRTEGQNDSAESRAELLQDALAEKGRKDEALQIMELRASWTVGKTGISATWQNEATDILGNTWESKALIESSLSERIISARESIRRLRLLLSLKDGAFVYDKTWGMGVVTRADLFNKKVEIDFERKIGHQLSLNYASETLQRIGEDHLLVWKKHKPEELARLVAKEPAEVIRMYLQSFGSAPIAQIQKTLQAGIVAASDWKRFWDAARKDLKKDPNVVVPTLRTDNIRFAPQSSVETTAVNDLTALSRERDLKTLVEGFEELADAKNPPALSDADRRLLSERLDYILHGATQKQLGIRARALIAASRLSVEPGAQHAGMRDKFFLPDNFVPTMKQLSARASRAFLRYLAAVDAARLNGMLGGLLARLDIGTLNEVIVYLQESGQEASTLGKVYQTVLSQRKPSVELVSWLARNMDRIDALQLGTYAPWVMMMVDELEQDYMGDQLKAQNQLRERFSKQDWLKDVMANLDNQQRRNLLVRVKDSAGWDMLDRQLAMAFMIKLYPQLEEFLVAKNDQKDKDVAPVRALLTSKRSYRERQLQLQRIVSFEIPKVAKEIGIARSHGDLRENFEFKAAKENQLVLMRKRDDLDDMLRRVTPSDFHGFPFDVAGLATGVTLEYAGGKRERYFILGEWDGDPALGIISCTSKMALALTGHRAGESVTVPTETGDAVIKLVEVTGLTEEINAWVNTEASA